jgi:hypothetical protein
MGTDRIKVSSSADKRRLIINAPLHQESPAAHIVREVQSRMSSPAAHIIREIQARMKTNQHGVKSTARVNLMKVTTDGVSITASTTPSPAAYIIRSIQERQLAGSTTASPAAEIIKAVQLREGIVRQVSARVEDEDADHDHSSDTAVSVVTSAAVANAVRAPPTASSVHAILGHPAMTELQLWLRTDQLRGVRLPYKYADPVTCICSTCLITTSEGATSHVRARFARSTYFYVKRGLNVGLTSVKPTFDVRYTQNRVQRT